MHSRKSVKRTPNKAKNAIRSFGLHQATDGVASHRTPCHRQGTGPLGAAWRAKASGESKQTEGVPYTHWAQTGRRKQAASSRRGGAPGTYQTTAPTTAATTLTLLTSQRRPRGRTRWSQILHRPEKHTHRAATPTLPRRHDRPRVDEQQRTKLPRPAPVAIIGGARPPPASRRAPKEEQGDGPHGRPFGAAPEHRWGCASAAEDPKPPKLSTPLAATAGQRGERQRQAGSKTA
jgi:hypothetical protein